MDKKIYVVYYEKKLPSGKVVIDNFPVDGDSFRDAFKSANLFAGMSGCVIVGILERYLDKFLVDYHE